MTGEAGVKRVALYIRVSTDEQAEHGYSIPEQRRELMEHARREGWRVVDVIDDGGHSGAVGVRPGLADITTLAEAGEIDLVLAKKRNRFFRDRFMRMGYERSLREHGVSLVALDDVGHRFGDAVMDEFSDWYREEVAQNTRAGRMQKAREGKLIASPRPPYGFGFTPDGEGYVVVPHQMAVVRRVVESISSGESIRGARKMLEKEGVPAPRGGLLWRESIVRGFVTDDVYRSISYAEIAPMLTPEARSRLDKNGEYGVVWYPKLKIVRGDPDPTRNYARPRKQSRYEREEQIPIPVVSSGIPRELIDAARERLAHNVVSRSTSGRVFPLQGVLTCGGCGNNISSNRKRDGGKDYHYYRCQHYQRHGHARCGMSKSFPAERLEESVLHTVLDAVKDRDALIEKTNGTFEREKANLLRAGGADVAAWQRRLDGLAEREARAQRAYMESVISLEDLRARTAELDRERKHVKGLLAEHAGRAERLKELEAAREKALRQIEGGEWADLGITTPEARKERYREIGLSGELNADGTATLRWGLGEKMVLRTNESTSRGIGRPRTARS